MRRNIPDEVSDAIHDLEVAEKDLINNSNIEYYVENLRDFHQYKDEFPENRKFIENIANAHTRNIVNYLYKTKPDLSFSSWLDVIIILFAQNKEYTLQYVKENENIKDYFVSLVSLWSEKKRSDLNDILEDLLS